MVHQQDNRKVFWELRSQGTHIFSMLWVGAVLANGQIEGLPLRVIHQLVRIRDDVRFNRQPDAL